MDMRPAMKALAVFVGLALFTWMLYAARDALFPFAVAFVFAYLLDPVVDRLVKAGVSRSTAILILLAALFSMLALAVALLAPLISAQVEALARNAPGYVESVKSRVAPFIESLPEMDRAKVEESIRDSMGALGDAPLKIVKAVSQSLWAGFSSAVGFIFALFNLIIIPVATFYLLKDFDVITSKLASRVPPRNRERALGFFTRLDEVLNSFFRGQLTVASILAVYYATGLFFIGAPMGILIGLLAGFSNIVPYMPIFVGLLPALFLTWLQYPGWEYPLMTLALFGVGQAFEGLFLTPRVMESAVGLHPVAVMAAIFIGGSFFGFTGILLAAPAAAALKVALEELDRVYTESDFFKQGAGPEQE